MFYLFSYLYISIWPFHKCDHFKISYFLTFVIFSRKEKPCYLFFTFEIIFHFWNYFLLSKLFSSLQFFYFFLTHVHRLFFAFFSFFFSFWMTSSFLYFWISLFLRFSSILIFFYSLHRNLFLNFFSSLLI